MAATRLGARVAFIARVGADRRGREVVKSLKEEGVATKFIVRDDTDHTGVALVLVGGNGEKQILSVPGANDELSVEQVRRAGSAIQSARVLLTQLEVPLETLLLASRLTREAGAKVLLDPSPPTALPDELMQRLWREVRHDSREVWRFQQARDGISDGALTGGGNGRPSFFAK